MKRSSNAVKLGAFILIGLAVALVAAVAMGCSSVFSNHNVYVLFFDESVNGLDTSAPVKFKGVEIGNVIGIQICRSAENERLVAVFVRIDLEKLRQRGFGAPAEFDRILRDDKMFGQLAIAGLTFRPYVELSTGDAKPFHSGRKWNVAGYSQGQKYSQRQIPSKTSTVNGLIAELEEAMNADSSSGIITNIVSLVPEAHRALLTVSRTADLAGRLLEANSNNISSLIEDARDTLHELRNLQRLGQAFLPSLGIAITNTNAKLSKAFDSITSNVQDVSGFVTTNSDSLATLLHGLSEASPELIQTLQQLRTTAESVQDLSDYLVGHPDAVLRGRASSER